jgi:hypothetical protein
VERACLVVNVQSTKLNSIVTLVTDIILLLIMLIGLLRLGFHESGVQGLGHLMWTQVGVSALFAIFSGYVACVLLIMMRSFHKGLVWLFCATIAYVPPVVSGANCMYPSL